MARARRRWIRQQGLLDTTRLVFIDETAITTNMVRVRGRCPRGERLVSHVPQGEWKTITCIAGLRHDRMTAPMVIEGAMDGPAFLAYIREYLGPTLRRGDIVVMDNCRVHKVAGVKEAIEARRATVEYLPAYSPDLNPIDIDQSWRLSRIKGLVVGWGDGGRKARARRRSGLVSSATRQFERDPRARVWRGRLQFAHSGCVVGRAGPSCRVLTGAFRCARRVPGWSIRRIGVVWARGAGVLASHLGRAAKGASPFVHRRWRAAWPDASLPG